MTNDRAQAIVDKMTGKRKLAARIVNTVRFPTWGAVLAYMDSGKFGDAASMVMDSVRNDPEALADMIWEG